MRASAGVEAAAARLRAESLKALKARLALGIDLAAVESFALVAIADDLVSGIKLGEMRSCLRVVFVGVGVQFLGEAPISALDIGLACTLGNPQNLVGVAHRVKTPVNPHPPDTGDSTFINVGFRRGGCNAPSSR